MQVQELSIVGQQREDCACRAASERRTVGGAGGKGVAVKGERVRENKEREEKKGRSSFFLT